MYLRLAAVALLLAVSGCDCRGAALVDKPEPDCKPETCDGYDEDCDGVVDNGLPELSCGVGACARRAELRRRGHAGLRAGRARGGDLQRPRR